MMKTERSVEEFVRKYNIVADAQQLEVIKHADGAVNLIATAGSGKTRTIINRIGYMTRVLNVAPESILAVTFTVAAAREMKERYINSFCNIDEYSNNDYTLCASPREQEEERALYEAGAAAQRLPRFSTINAFCAGVVRKAQSDGLIPQMEIPPDNVAVFNAAVRAAYARQSTAFLSDASLSELKIAICRIKNEMLNSKDEINKLELSDDMRGIDLYGIYSAYNQYLYNEGFMDFDDQMRFARKCFIKFPQVLEFYRKRYRYIILDESQDTSKLQFDILRRLVRGNTAAAPGGGAAVVNASVRGGVGGNADAAACAPGAPDISAAGIKTRAAGIKIDASGIRTRAAGIMICGDDDQSIYSFRGASPESLFSFNSDYPGARTFYLETNYRSRSEIVEAAGRLIEHNNKRFRKGIRPGRKRGASGTPEKSGAPEQKGGACVVGGSPGNSATITSESCIKTLRAFGLKEQYKMILDEVIEFTVKNPGKKVAVLYKNNDSVIPLIDLADRSGARIRCRREDFLFFSSPVVEDIRSIVRVILDPKDAESFMKMYYKAGGLYISKSIAESWRQSVAKDGVIKTVVRDLGSSADESDNRKAERFCDFMDKARSAAPSDALRIILKQGGYENYLSRRSGSDAAPRSQLRKVDTLRAIAENCATLQEFMDRLDYLNMDPYAGMDANVYFSTIHSAKGLEFDKVIFADPYQDIFSPGPKKEESDGEELRRLFYVAVTRAIDELTFCAAERAYGVENQMSDFYYEFTGQEKPRARAQQGSAAAARIMSEVNAHQSIESSAGARRYDSRISRFASRRPDENGELVFTDERSRRASEAAALKTKLPDFKPGATVEHKKYGIGVITVLEGTKAGILFDNNEDIKTIDLKYAVPNGAIELKKK